VRGHRALQSVSRHRCSNPAHERGFGDTSAVSWRPPFHNKRIAEFVALLIRGLTKAFAVDSAGMTICEAHSYIGLRNSVSLIIGTSRFTIMGTKTPMRRHKDAGKASKLLFLHGRMNAAEKPARRVVKSWPA
jgi:hypothetical protein